MAEAHVKKSKFLSYILRHNPGAIGLEMDKQGWVNVADLISLSQKQEPLSFTTIVHIVDTDSKGRYEMSEGASHIRAVQGHSIAGLDLGYKPTIPPSSLYHGTAARSLESIMAVGILKGNREYVHLSDNEATAKTVGARHGKPVIITVNAEKMHKDGIEFFRAANGVWLTLHVDKKYFKEIRTSV